MTQESPALLAPQLRSLIDRESLFAELQQKAMSENTRIAYDKSWRRWVGFCKEICIDPYAATGDHVATFLYSMSQTGLSYGTINLYRSGINRYYRDRGLSSPTSSAIVKVVMTALARILGTRPRQVKALEDYHVLSILDSMTDAPIHLRDAAVIAIGFAGALRRSEICALRVDDLQFVLDGGGENAVTGLLLSIRKSKTDQTGEGVEIPIPAGKRIRPVARLVSYMDALRIESGFLFRSMRKGGLANSQGMHHSDIPRIVKTYAEKIGLDPQDYSAHSLRAGFVTSAAKHQARLDKIMEVTRHVQVGTEMKYIRDEDAFRDHAGETFL